MNTTTDADHGLTVQCRERGHLNGDWRYATDAEIAQAYANLARTTPPTVDDVGDVERCLVWYINSYPSPKWLIIDGISARIEFKFTPDAATHWLPMPPQPNGGE